MILKSLFGLGETVESVTEAAKVVEGITETSEAIKDVAEVAEGATEGTSVLAGSFSKLAVSAAPIIPILVAIGAALVAAHMYMTRFSRAVDNASESLSDYQKASSELENLENQAENAKSSLEEMAGKYNIELDGSETVDEIIDKLDGIETISLTDETDLANLKAENEELERQIELQKKITETAQIKSEKDAKEALNMTATKDLSSGEFNELTYGVGLGFGLTGYDAIEYGTEYENTDIRTATKNEIARIEEINAEKLKLNEEYNKAKTEAVKKSINSEIAELDDEYENLKTAVIENIDTLNSLKDSFKDSTNAEGKAIYEDINKIIDSYNDINLSSLEKSKKIIDSFFDGSTGRNYIKQDLIDVAKSGNITEEALNRLGLSLEDLGLSGEEGLSTLNRYFKDLTKSINEATAAVDEFEPPTVDDVESAFESENQGADYDSMAEKLASAKELAKKGLYGTDDVQTMTQWILPDKIDDESFGSEAYIKAWKEAYGKVKNWFNTDDPAKGMWSFLSDLNKKNSDLFSEFNKSKGLIKFSEEFENSAQAAEELGVNVNVVDTMLHKLKEYGFTFDENFKFSGEMLNEYKTALSGIQEIYDSTEDEELKAHLNVILEEESKKNLETNLDDLTKDQIIEIQFKYDLAQLDQKIAELRAAAAGEGYGNTTSNADLLATNEARARKWEEGNETAAQDQEYIKIGNKISKIQSNMVGKDADTRAKMQRDILAIQEFRTAYQNAFDSGDAVNWEDFLNSNSVKDVLNRVKEEFNLTEEEIEKILGRQLPDVEVNAELNDEDAQTKLKELAEGEVVTYVTFKANVDDLEETVKAYNDENGTVHYTNETEDGKKQELSQIKSVKDGEEVVSYTAEIDFSNVDEKIKEFENGTTIDFLANLDGVEQRVQAVKNEDGIITYTANIDGAEQGVAKITHQDGTVEYNTEINSENIDKKIKELENGSTIEFTADIDGVEKQFEVLKDEDGTIIYTLKAEDEATATAEYAWSILTQIPEEVWTYLYSDDQASDDVISFIAETTKIPKDTLTRINAEDGASGVLAYIISVIAKVPKENVTNLLATDNASGIASLVSNSIGNIPLDHETLLKAKDQAKPIVDKVNKEVESVPRDHKVTFSGSIGSSLQSSFTWISNKISNLKQKASNILGGAGLAGTAHLSGTAYAKGNIPVDAFINPRYRTKDSDIALTGEEGQELVVNGNRWWTVGDRGAEFSPIPKGSVIFNARQTKELFENGFTNSRGRAYLSGTAYESGGFLPSGSSGSSSSNSSSSSSSKKSSSNSSSNSSSSSDDFEEIIDWIEIYLERQARITERLIDAIEDGVGLLAKQTATDKAIAQTQAEIVANQKAYNRYQQEANSVNLAESYKQKVRNGTIDIQTITDEDLKKKIEDYQTWYEKMLDCEDTIEDLKDQLSELAQTKFDNVTTEFENQISLIEHEINLLESSIDLIEDEGYVVSTKFYDELIKQEDENYKKLQSEYATLNNTLNDLLNKGLIKKYSNEWYEMVDSINEVSEAILDSKAATVEYKNAIRDLEWDLFDKTQDMLSQIQEESDFLIDLMSNDKMYDSDTAKITDQGQATLGLHAVNYNAYMAQADEYAKEMQKIDKELANDPYNQTLLERRQELLETQRDMIQSAEDEKQAIKDLVSDGYDAFLDVMQKAIDKRKELLDNVKDLYDYEKNISEQTKEIAQIEKQLNAYQGNTSEETRATIQQLKVSLEEAKQNLEETEYDQYISDQEKMLDTLYDETEAWINERLDNLELIIQDVINSTNENAESIKETLTNEANEVGTTLSDEMNAIWSPGGTYASVVATYQENFSSLLTTTNNTLSDIKDYIASLVKDSDKKESEAQASAAKVTTPAPSTPSTTTGTSSTSSASNSSTSSSSTSTSSSSTSSSKWGSWFIKKKYSYPKSKLNKDTSIVDRLAYFDFDNSFSVRKKYYKAMGKNDTYKGTASQNKWMISQMKSHGFAKGGTIGDLIKQTGEDGFILARTGEEILSLDKIKELQNTFVAMDSVLNNLVKIPQLPYSTVGNNGTINNDIVLNLELPNVHNVDDFVTELRNNKRFEKVIQQITLGSMTGKNNLIKYSY